MAKQLVEIDIPDGMQVSGIQSQLRGAVAVHIEPIPTTKWRAPTKMDLLSVDSIPGQARDSEADPWLDVAIRAVATCGGYRYVDIDGAQWRYAEIEVPADKPHATPSA